MSSKTTKALLVEDDPAAVGVNEPLLLHVLRYAVERKRIEEELRRAPGISQPAR